MVGLFVGLFGDSFGIGFFGGFGGWFGFFGSGSRLWSWGGGRSDWLLVNNRGRNSVALGGEGWVTLGKDNNALDKTPNGVAGHSNPTDRSKTEEEDA